MPSNHKIAIKIEGEIGKHQTLPIDYLINLAKHLQDLIGNIANYDLSSDEPIDLNNFKLELTDFKKGSSVPVFCYSHQIQNTLHSSVLSQRKIVSKKFDELMKISDKSKYLDLKKLYPEPIKRNKITDSLYDFVKSFGTSPATILDDKFKPIYKIKPFKKELHDEIVTEIIKIGEPKKPLEKHVQLARVEIMEGKVKPKVLELFDKKYSHVMFSPEVIIAGNKVYELKFPLSSTMETEEGMIIIENKFLGIYASGASPDEAEEAFNEEFDYLYTRYNELSDKKLTDDVKAIKSFLNHIVKK
jgi:hypothetical protein